MSIDYQAELSRIESFTGDFWKPKAGQYTVKAVGEIEEGEPVAFKEGDKPQERASLAVEVEGKRFMWDFPKGKTKASTYGQLAALASKTKVLNEQTFKVVVIGEGQSIRFTIVT